MMLASRTKLWFLAVFASIPLFGGITRPQQTPYPKPNELPNPYRLVEGWPTLPKSMNGGQWGEVIRVHVDAKGNSGSFTAASTSFPRARPPASVAVQRIRRFWNLILGQAAEELWRGTVCLQSRVHRRWRRETCGRPTSTIRRRSSACPPGTRHGVIMGQEVLKLSPEGKILMMLGKQGVAGTGPDAFDRPTSVAVAPNGDIFVSDGHAPNKYGAGRVVKFSKDGHFIKAWGRKGSAPGEFDEPHDIFVGGSRGWVYVADRKNNRIQVFDQRRHFIAAWKQFGQPSSVFVGKDDTIYVGASFPDASAKKGELRGITIGNAIDGSLKAFIPDPADLDKVVAGTSASGIAADSMGSVFAADVGAHNLRKYVKVR